MSRLLIGNLDCELTWAGRGGALPLRVMRLMSAAATLLRAFAENGDRLWTATPVAASRCPLFEGAPRVELLSGPLAPLLAAQQGPGRPAGARGAVLAWAATAATATATATAATEAAGIAPGSAPAAHARTWSARLWQASSCSEAAARTANDRRMALELASDLGVALPGARTVTSLEALEAHLRAGGADAGGGAWVAKAPHTAAGRDRIRGQGGRLDPATARLAGRLFLRFGTLVFEPWCLRVADLGCCGLVAEDRTTGPQGAGSPSVLLAPPHRLLNDPHGTFRGIVVDEDGTAAGLDAAQRRQLSAIADAAGRALFAVGYRGPFGIDAFLWRDTAGTVRLHPLCEINARLTFGWVARAWAERLGEPLTLQLGPRPPPGARLLLTAGEHDPTAAWIGSLPC